MELKLEIKYPKAAVLSVFFGFFVSLLIWFLGENFDVPQSTNIFEGWGNKTNLWICLLTILVGGFIGFILIEIQFMERPGKSIANTPTFLV